MSAPYPPQPSPQGGPPNWQQPNPMPPSGPSAPGPGGPYGPPPGAPGPGMPPAGAPGPGMPPGAYGGPPGPYGTPPGLTPNQRRKRLLIVVPVALVALVGIIVLRGRSSGSDEAAVGDCVKKTSDQTTSSGQHVTGDNIKTVACTDASASYKVVGKVEHVSRISVSIKEMDGKGVCSPYPSATVRYWRGKTGGGDGYVLCLAPNQH
ncbi:hypothetical protein GCM10023196_069570 [Actinoallomurus vinaceus]|uniref:Uncharacterized protein n=1 Tax=Actinoallomurus vinaceus TaxID=1080074 RepID=A0ABP8UJE4_9ACTN